MKVSLFITCMADVFAWQIGQATIALLEKYGCTVDFPENQTCCGQPSYNSGYQKDTMNLMKHMLDVFDDANYVVAPSGSCVAMLRTYENLLQDDPIYGPKARALAKKSYEISDFLYQVLHVRSIPSTFEGIVTYHPSCHMTRLLGVKEAPLRLLESIPRVQVVQLPGAEDCCGFGGTFSVNNPVISNQMVDEKVNHLKETGANYLVGGDLACLMNIKGRLSRQGVQVEVLHLVQIFSVFEEKGVRR